MAKWTDIVGYEGLYKVSDVGEVYAYPKSWTAGHGSTLGHQGKMRKSHKGANGYLNVTLCDKKQRYHAIHRLVASHFVENPNGYKVVNHIDGNKLNNHADNLEWCNQSFNVKEAYRMRKKKVADENVE